jgi:hypothetical protein
VARSISPVGGGWIEPALIIDMEKIEVVLRPFRLHEVRQALARAGLPT